MAEVFLREFEENHLPETFKWMQDNNLKRDFMFESCVTEEGHKKWYQCYCKDQSQKIWAIFYGDVYVGNIGLKNIDYHNRKAEVWIYLGEQQWQGKRVGTNTFQVLFSDFVFLSLGLHKIYSYVANWNIASQKMFFNAGFQEEGILYDEVFFNGKYVTMHRFGIILNN